jgi:hypothetical protein
MATFTRFDELQGATFVGADLRGARFVGADLSGVVMRGVDLDGADVDAPWLPEAERFLVNGVDVIPFVEAELNRRFPGRADRYAQDPAGLRAAWDVLQRTWAATLERVAAMPVGTVDVSVDGEWSFAQTLRHLVMATDTWLRRAILQVDQPYHPIGQPDSGAGGSGLDLSIFVSGTPSYAEVLEVRAARVAMVRDFLDAVTPEQLAESRLVAPESLAGVVDALSAEALVESREGALRLSAEGKLRALDLVTADRAQIGEEASAALLEAFHGFDSRMKQIVTAWQVREVAGAQAINDHADAGYDAGVLEDLAALHAETAAWLAPTADALPRFTVYASRLERALELARGGDQRFVASPRVDSYHGVWFELHEDLIRLAGRRRSDEAAAGRA